MSYDIFNSGEFGGKHRRTIFYAAILCVCGLYILRLIQLQVLEGEKYRTQSEAQAIKQIIKDPVRGAMYDRNGTLLVHNIPSFSISVTPGEFDMTTLNFMAGLLSMDTTEFREKLLRYKRISPTTPVKIFRDANDSLIAIIEENRELLRGVIVTPESKRIYEYLGNSPHIFGYTREITEDELKNFGDAYRPGDMIGKAALEASYENFLRGKTGKEYMAVNVRGEKVASFVDGKIDSEPEDGWDLNLGIEMRLQQCVDSLMKKHRGAVVAIEPQTGEILALMSKPDYDPRIFSGRSTSEQIDAIQHDSLRPMFNRATMTQYPPGSTWKMLMALAALQEGIITDVSTLYCPEWFVFGTRKFHSHGVGNLTVRHALQVSSNSFFYQLALKLGTKRFYEYGKMFGFGDRSGSDLPGGEEGRGVLPSEEYMNRRKGKNGWGEGSLVNWGIGQGEVGVTPLQMAAYTATIANKGTWNQPHIVRSLINKQNRTVHPTEYASHQIPIDKRHFDVVHDGMFAVANLPGGTAYKELDHTGVKLLGKTGTAQNRHGNDHSWFVCFAPRENPQIALCVMVENAGAGASVAAPLAQKIVQRYLDLQKTPQTTPANDPPARTIAKK